MDSGGSGFWPPALPGALMEAGEDRVFSLDMESGGRGFSSARLPKVPVEGVGDWAAWDCASSMSAFEGWGQFSRWRLTLTGETGASRSLALPWGSGGKGRGFRGSSSAGLPFVAMACSEVRFRLSPPGEADGGGGDVLTAAMARRR